MSTIPIPVLETERLLLRGPEPRDAAAFIAFHTGERAHYLGGPRTPGQAWRHFAAEIGHWAICGFGMWVVTDKSDAAGGSLGMVGLWHPIDWPEHEMGWFMWDAGEGRGMAREAALAARRHAYRVLGWDTLVSYIDPDNARSIRLAERLGAVHDPDAARPDGHSLVYRHPAPGTPA